MPEQKQPKLSSALRRLASTTALDLAACALVVVGVAQIYPPAAYIAAAAVLALVSWRLSR